MKKQLTITLFGAAGTRTVDITPRGGFPTRHIKVPRETEPYLLEPGPRTPDAVPPPSLLEILEWMRAAEPDTHWFIIDEILFVATAHYKMKFNQQSLLDALRELYEQGHLAYRLNRFDQHTFQLIGGE